MKIDEDNHSDLIKIARQRTSLDFTELVYGGDEDGDADDDGSVFDGSDNNDEVTTRQNLVTLRRGTRRRLSWLI